MLEGLIAELIVLCLFAFAVAGGIVYGPVFIYLMVRVLIAFICGVIKLYAFICRKTTLRQRCISGGVVIMLIILTSSMVNFLTIHKGDRVVWIEEAKRLEVAERDQWCGKVIETTREGFDKWALVRFGDYPPRLLDVDWLEKDHFKCWLEERSHRKI